MTAIRHGTTLAIYKNMSATPGEPTDIPNDLVDAGSKALDAAVHTAS